VLRAPNELWKKLEPRVQKNLVAALKSSRSIDPGENNWKPFASTIEVFLHTVGEKRDDARLFEALRKHRGWYVGDGMYGDGPEFHWDYYNSFVIQPMLLENLDVVGDEAAEWKTFGQKVREHLAHFTSIEEELRTLKRVMGQKFFENRDVVGHEAGKWRAFREKVRDEAALHDSELRSLGAAIAEAGKRVEAQRASEQQAQAREIAKELAVRADAIAVHAAELDSANMTRIAAARAISEELQKMRALAHGLDVFVPSEQQFLSLGERAERTVLMATPWSRVAERIAPGERRTHSSYARPWRDQIVKAAGALMGTKHEEAA